MHDHKYRPTLKLDPWAASSLLQKAIRRGETDFAIHAAHTLYRHRGRAIWRRLVTIGFEDIGIADPKLLAELTYVASDKKLRAAIAAETELIENFCSRLAAAAKDRSADYLYCAATKLPEAQRTQSQLSAVTTDRRLAIAHDSSQPLITRAVAILLGCSAGREAQKVSQALLAAFFRGSPSDRSHWRDAVTTAARMGCHPFVLMLPILQSALLEGGQSEQVASDEIPPPEIYGGIPLYTFDKHTMVGKQAIASLVAENRDLRTTLKAHAPEIAWRSIAEIAAFYVDATPIKSRFQWNRSRELEAKGLEADMVEAGCPASGIDPILQGVRQNLPLLNELRRRALSRRVSK